MAFRIGRNVVRGEIDNRLRGRVTGQLWLAGREEPVELALDGNCLRDIAGHKLVFENPSPDPDQDLVSLTRLQEGVVGDITASRKVKTFDIPVEKAYEMRKRGETVPVHTANCLYIEWFSEANGRVVIELPHYRVLELSDPIWRMSRDDEQEQLLLNQYAIRDYMSRLSEAREETWDDEEYHPMDEFQWEQNLRESDALTDRFSELIEKYRDHPDSEKLIAREMGWDWLDDALDADARGAFEEERRSAEEVPELEPNPTTEGIDWIRTDDGHVKHPLSHRAFEMSMGIWRLCKEKDIIGDDGDDDLHNMVFEAQTLAAKLAGALDNLAYDYQPEPGFVVACLKRALQYFDKSFGASTKVAEKKLLLPAELDAFRRELFAIREEMLALMKKYRSTY